MIEVLTYSLLALGTFSLVAPPLHRLLAYRLEWPSSLALALAIALGAAAAGGLCWLVWWAPPTECIDFAPDASGRC